MQCPPPMWSKKKRKSQRMLNNLNLAHPTLTQQKEVQRLSLQQFQQCRTLYRFPKRLTMVALTFFEIRAFTELNRLWIINKILRIMTCKTQDCSMAVTLKTAFSKLCVWLQEREAHEWPWRWNGEPQGGHTFIQNKCGAEHRKWSTSVRHSLCFPVVCTMQFLSIYLQITYFFMKKWNNNCSDEADQMARKSF